MTRTSTGTTTANNTGSTSPAISHTDEILAWAVVAAQAADEKKGTDPLILHVGELLSITEAFVIASASNNRLVVTIAEEIEHQVKLAGGPSPLSVEGLSDASWVLIDFGSFVAHIFQQDVREFYDLERLWKEAPRIAWTPRVTAVAAVDDVENQ
jgi:ribosome-associated protein